MPENDWWLAHINGWELDLSDMTATAPDGCIVEIDGECPHGLVSPIDQII